jgi:carbamoyl-phosphate synthase small subunit
MKGYLKLQTGEQFEGECVRQFDECNGEVVFFTGMTGYQEVISDPSFKGQIVVFTYPLIGNYGINPDDFESLKPHVSGVVLCELSQEGCHYESTAGLMEELAKWQIPVLTGVDTRAVVQTIRTIGDSPGLITTNAESSVPSIDGRNLIAEAAGKKVETHGSGDPHIALIDFGYKKSILTKLIDLGCKVTVVPYDSNASLIQSLDADGILLSNGPGDPKQLTPYLQQIKQLALTYPTFGICLGHQLLALAYGGNTKKLTFGHRGANQPVQDLITGTVGMTAQNHSYVVSGESLDGTGFNVRYANINDGSIEGIVHHDKPITAVQFHPEGHPGPDDFEDIFSDFIKTVLSRKGEVVHA